VLLFLLLLTAAAAAAAAPVQMKHFLTSLNAQVLHLAAAHDRYLSAANPFVTLKVRSTSWHSAWGSAAQHGAVQQALAAAGSTEGCHVLAKERPQRCSSWAAVARCAHQHGIYIAAGVAWLGFLRYECSWWGSTARPVRHGQLAMANCQGLSFAALYLHACAHIALCFPCILGTR
jgi:hypothetical protein